MDTQNAVNMVPLHLAQQWTFAWQRKTEPIERAQLVKSFRFDKIDFTQITDKPGVVYVRTYPAMKTLVGESIAHFTLLAVGVDVNGNDIIDADPNSLDSGIYDFALPCPKTCGQSPLLAPELMSH